MGHKSRGYKSYPSETKGNNKEDDFLQAKLNPTGDKNGKRIVKVQGLYGR